MASSLTSSQIVAFIVAAFLCFIIFTGFESLSMIAGSGSVALTIKQLGILYHYDALSKGLIDSRDVIYFLTVIFLMLLITRIIVGSRSW